jgi:hypothetical protein
LLRKYLPARIQAKGLDKFSIAWDEEKEDELVDKKPKQRDELLNAWGSGF